ncbi:hypothetical protein F5Y09DRAFT_356417 [Xylaria sp. FL1042]|nr:hypothetical protein F5Y09DRAFT_356417 [Xylaria sp. FL1042]
MNSLPDQLAQCLQGRREIDLADNISNNFPTNAPRVEDTRPSMQNRRRRISIQQGTRPLVMPTPSSSFVGQPQQNPSIPSLEHSQNPLATAGSRRESLMTTSGARHPLAAPSIMVETCDQQQSGPSGPSSLWPGREQLSPSILGISNQFVSGVGQRSNRTRGHTRSTWAYTLADWDTPVVAKRDNTCQDSFIYRDVISDILAEPDGAKLVHPFPDFHPTMTGAGYDPKGGDFIPLTVKHRKSLRDKEGEAVRLQFRIVDRELVRNRSDEECVEIVLGLDYTKELRALQEMLAQQQQTEAPQFLNPTYPGWQTLNLSQNSHLSSENPVFDPSHQNNGHFDTTGWPSGGSQTHNLHPHYLAGSR